MNHPWARHLCKSLHEVNPKDAVPGGKLDNLKEERKRVLGRALRAMFPNLSFGGVTEQRETRRLIWSSLHKQGFHPFPVSRVDRLTKMLEAAKKRAKRREKAT